MNVESSPIKYIFKIKLLDFSDKAYHSDYKFSLSRVNITII